MLRARVYRNHQYLLTKLRFITANPVATDRGIRRFLALGLNSPTPIAAWEIFLPNGSASKVRTLRPHRTSEHRARYEAMASGYAPHGATPGLRQR